MDGSRGENNDKNNNGDGGGRYILKSDVHSKFLLIWTYVVKIVKLGQISIILMLGRSGVKLSRDREQ